MRIFVLGVLGLLVGCKAHHPALLPKPSAVKSTTLQYPSGLRVVFELHPGSGRVAIAALVGAGSGNDPIGREGAAHFVEHLAFRSRPAGRLSLWDELDFAGVASASSSTANAFTTFESTVFSGITPKDRVGSVLPLVASLVVQPLLGVDEKVFELERSVVRNEHLQRNPHGGGDIIAAVALSQFGAGVPGTRPISGTAASIAAISRSDLEQFVTANYRPEATTLVLVGDFEPEKLDALVRASFPTGWLNEGPNGPVKPLKLDRVAMAVNQPPMEPRDPPIVEAAVHDRMIIYSWLVPGTTEPGGSAMELVADAMRDAFFWVGRDKGVKHLSTSVIPGPVRSLLLMTVTLKPDAKPEMVSNEFHQYTRFGRFTAGDWRDLSISALFEEQNLQQHAENRARYVFATNSLGTPTLGVDKEGIEALKFLEHATLKWPNAREVHVAPLVKTNVGLDDPPPKLDEPPRRVVVQPAMVKSVALPPPLPEVKRFTLENGLQVVISRRTPMPLATVTLGLPAGSRHTTRPVSELVGAVLEWESVSIDMKAPRIRVMPDSTTLQMNGPAWHLPLMLDIFGHTLTPHVSFTSVTRAETVVERLLNAKEEIEDEKEERGEETAPVRPSLIKQLMAPQSSFIGVELEEAKVLHRADFVKFVDLAFRPNGAVLVVDGDLNIESTEKMVRELFSDWRPSKDELPPLRDIGALPPRQAKPEVIEAQEALVTEVRLACRLPPVTSPEQHGGIALLERALALYFGDDLRIARGLTYGVSSTATAYRNEDNLLVLVATLDPRGKQAALERFVQRLDELDGAVWDEQIVDVARWRVAKGFMGTVATSPSVSRLLAGEMARGATFEDTLAIPLRLSSTALKYVDEAWSACSDTLALEIEGERSSIEAVLKRRAKK